MLLTGLGAALGRISQIQQTLTQLDAPPVQNTTASSGGAFERVLAEAQQTGSPSTPSASSRRQASSTSSRFQDIIHQAASKYGVDEDLVHAVVQAESDYNPSCRSGAGAVGLMQLMPGTARSLGVDANDPAQNVDGGVRYLRQQLDRFGEVDLAVAAYNAGPGAVSRYHGVPPYRETQAYVKRVLQTLWQRKGD